MAVNLRSLISKLNDTSVIATETAAGLAKSQSHKEVDVEHLLLELFKIKGTDVQLICEFFGLRVEYVIEKLNIAVLNLTKSSSKVPVLSVSLINLIELSWVVSSVDFSAPKIRSGHILVALLRDSYLFNIFSQRIEELTKIEINQLSTQFGDITRGSIEGVAVNGKSAKEAIIPSNDSEVLDMGPLESLQTYATDMTDLVSQGLVDPVIGRDQEVRQLIDVLARRRQNNPILIGDAGVGKTAVVEGLALKIGAGDVPADLKLAKLFSLDLGLLQAGASVKGEFESRLKAIVDEIEKSVVPVVLFIDEVHTLVGAGGQAGQNDAANLLKPALARGALRTIGATTWSEYKKYIEKDSALSRRFQVIKVSEPSESQAIVMLRGIAKTMESHHGVRILDEAILSAVKLSSRYITGRLLPDKAISVLDTAAARSSISMDTLPGAIEDLRAQQVFYETELTQLMTEQHFDDVHEARIVAITAELKDLIATLTDYEEQWEKEREIIGRLEALEQLLKSEKPPPSEEPVITNQSHGDRKKYQAVMKELNTVQGESPMISPLVNSRLISEVVSDWTGIPTGKMMSSQVHALQNLEDLLGARVIGQDHALRTISERIKTSRSGMEDPGKPVGVFLLVGSSGVGKTETAIALADTFFGGDRSLITINMSEYQEPHSVSLLRGSPPGYVGYGTGGVLTEAVKRQPYSVLLLDEVEKSHPDVLEVFYQIFDKGVMDDGEGQEVDFKNTIILLTSNACSEMVSELFAGNNDVDIKSVVQKIRPHLQKVFQPALLGRLSIIPYKPISKESLGEIARAKLLIYEKRLLSSHSIRLKYEDGIIENLVKRSTSIDIGARALDETLNTLVAPVISELILDNMTNNLIIEEIFIKTSDDFESKLAFQVNHKVADAEQGGL